MQVVVFQFWLLILVLLSFYSLWKRNALFLFVIGLGFLAFGWSLTFDGLEVINGVNKSTGAFTYDIITPQNDALLSILAVVALPLGIAMSLFSLSVLLDETLKRPSKVKS